MTSTAVAAAGWGRAKWKWGTAPAALPGPLMSPAGNLPDGGTGGAIGLTVEIFVNSAWTDISQWVYYRAGATQIPITRGRGDEVSDPPPQTATLVLNNRDGRFSPRNPTGPYYGQLTMNTPIRISRLNNGVRRYRFHGEVPAWPMSSDISGNDVVTTVTAAGMKRRLAQGSKPLRSPMFRAYTIGYSSSYLAASPVLMPVAYWPAEDGSTATQVASGLNGGTAMTVSGSPTFANNGDFPGSAALPLLNGSTWTGAVPSATTTANVLRFLLSVPPGGAANNAVVMRLTTAGTIAHLDAVYTTASGGSLTMIGYGSTGSTVFTSTALTGINGAPGIVLMALTADPTPGTTDYTFGFTPVTGIPSLTAATFSGATGVATQVVVNPAGSVMDTAVGHVSYQAAAQPTFADQVNSAMTAWTGESPLARYIRLCGEQNIASVLQAVSGGQIDATVMGYQTIDTFSTLIKQIADTLFLPVYEARDQLALMLRSRGTMYNQSAHLTLDLSQHQLSAPLVPVDDDAMIRNDVTVTRTGGSSYEAVLSSGARSVQVPPLGVGTYDTEYQLSLGSDALLADQAGWRLRFGTVDEPRYPQVSLNLRHETFTSSVDMMNAALTLDIGDRIVIKNAKVPNYPPDDISLIVQGYTEVLGTFEHDMVINCTPESPWRVGITDDATLGHADTDGSTLAADYPLGTETALAVATTNASSPLWTTTAGDFPFDVSVGGERMTVTNITGSSSPQTFTVTRSINSIVKSQTSGTDVRLWQPSYTSL